MADTAQGAGSIDWVVVATFILAAVTAYLGWQTKAVATAAGRQFKESAAAEAERRAEAAKLSADPLTASIGSPPLRTGQDGWPILIVAVKNTGSRVVSAITVTIRSNCLAGGGSPAHDALVPGQDFAFRLPLGGFTIGTAGGPTQLPAVNYVLVDVASYGLLGQRVFQTYVCRLDRLYGVKDGGPLWYQVRMQINPVGSASTQPTSP